MNIKSIIEELRKLGMDVKYRKRTDGGYLIQQINNMTFTGSKGNAYARHILGIELSQSKIEQTSYNVTKYIADQKKKATLEPEIKKELKKVQRQWQKKGVKAKVTARKVKEHIAKDGKAAAKEYLGKMTRYGEGLAYLDNVEWLAKYYEDLGRGAILDDDLQNALFDFATKIRSKAEFFKEEWIGKLYRAGYDIRNALAKAQVELAKSHLETAKSIIA